MWFGGKSFSTGGWFGFGSWGVFLFGFGCYVVLFVLSGFCCFFFLVFFGIGFVFVFVVLDTLLILVFLLFWCMLMDCCMEMWAGATCGWVWVVGFGVMRGWEFVGGGYMCLCVLVFVGVAQFWSVCLSSLFVWGSL